MACKYGKLKNPAKTKSGGKRYCKKAPKKAKARRAKRGKTPKCRHGKLKNPVKGRVCKKKPGGRRRR